MTTRIWLISCLAGCAALGVFWTVARPHDARSRTPPQWQWIHPAPGSNPWLQATAPQMEEDTAGLSAETLQAFASQFVFTPYIPERFNSRVCTEARAVDASRFILTYGVDSPVRVYGMWDPGGVGPDEIRLGHDKALVLRHSYTAYACVGDVDPKTSWR